MRSFWPCSSGTFVPELRVGDASLRSIIGLVTRVLQRQQHTALFVNPQGGPARRSSRPPGKHFGDSMSVVAAERSGCFEVV